MMFRNLANQSHLFKYKTQEGVLVMDSEGVILSANPPAEEIFGFPNDEMKGKPCYEICQGLDLAGNSYCFKGCSIMEMVRRNEPVNNFDIQILTRSRKKIWLNVTTLIDSGSSDRKEKTLIHLFRQTPSPMGMENFFRQIPALNETLTKSRDLIESFQKASNVTLRAKRFSLSPREAEVLTLLTKGFGVKEISPLLDLSTTTVRTHIQRILKKLQVHSMLEAVALVLR